MRLPGKGADADLVPWDRRYPVPLGGARLGGTGHVDDHNAVALQLPELWKRVESLDRQIDRLRTYIITLGILLVLTLIILGFVAYMA